MTQRICAVSVDLDEIPNYFGIHGMGAPEGRGATAVYDVALRRLVDLALDVKVPLTLFVIGRDLERPDAAKQIGNAHKRGHEIANHSLDHRYDLTRLSTSDIRDQVGNGADAIQRVTGARPVGFRAPGYTVTDALFDVLEGEGVLYDSSVFPCPAYWGAKRAAIGWMRARGRPSRSVADTPRVLGAPTAPYRVGRPYWTRGSGLLELPVQVTPGLRLPYIGTSLTLWGPAAARLMTRMCVGEGFINLELHGIDVLDAKDGLEDLRSVQPDVRVPVARKMESLYAAIETLKGAGYTFLTLKDAALRGVV